MPEQTKKSVDRLVYRTGELAEALGTSRWTVNRLIERGELSTTQVASTTVITRDEVQRYLDRHATRATKKPVATVPVADQPDAAASQ